MLIPLPFVNALVCAVLAVRLALARSLPVPSRAMFVFLFAVSTLESVLVGLRFGYGIEGAIVVQRLLPMLIGPSMYLGFRAMYVAPMRRGILLHLGIAIALTAVASQLFVALDAAIALSYATYWGLLFAQYRQAGDGFALMPMHATERMRLWLLGALVILAGIFVLDTAIAVSFALRVEGAVAPMIAVGSVPITGLLIVAVLNVPVGRQVVVPPIQDDEIERITAFLAETRLYRDPELTLARFARRMSLPVRQISRAINAATGASVSNYINELRIKEASDLLRDTEGKIDDIAQAVGFMSRSNFYREFQRVHGVSPSVFRKQSRRDVGDS